MDGDNLPLSLFDYDKVSPQHLHITCSNMSHPDAEIGVFEQLKEAIAEAADLCAGFVIEQLREARRSCEKFERISREWKDDDEKRRTARREQP